MKKIKFIILTLLLGMTTRVWAEAYSYYIIERVDQTIYFKGTNTAPDNNNHQYSITHEDNGIPFWAKGEGTVWPTVTKIVFEPSFAEARPTSTKYWFAQKPNLTSIVGMQQYLNTSEVTTMNGMFKGCSSLTELDLTGFNTANVTSMSHMFEGCSNLTTIVVSTEWTTGNVPPTTWSNDPSYNMFKDCTSLVGQDGTKYSDLDNTITENVNKTRAHYGEGGYLTSEGRYWNEHSLAEFSDISGTTITIHNIGEMNLLAQNVNNGTTYSGYTFLLAKDLSYDIGIVNNYSPIGFGSSDTKYYAGTFDGQGHTISGINLSGEGRQGLFGTIGGATIKNLTLSASTITLTNNSIAGGIVAYIKKGATASTIENCHVTNDVSIDTKGHGGGIAGYVWSGETVIQGCTSAASIIMRNNDYDIGGIIGYCGYSGTNLEDKLNITVSNCLYYGASLSAAQGYSGHIGGIFGGYYSNYNNGGYSIVRFSNNYYTYPDASVKGVGHESIKSNENTTNSSNIDLTADYAAVRAHAVSEEADIADMGTAGTPIEGGITPYTYGIRYGDTYYSHVLALENDGDYTTALSAYNGQTYNVKLRGRTLYKDGSWNTLCLPFRLYSFNNTIFSGGNCEVCEMDINRKYYIETSEGQYDANSQEYYTGVNGGRLYLFFRNVTTNIPSGTPYVTEGTPYIVKWEKVNDYNPNDSQYDHYEPTFENVTIEAGGPSAVTSRDSKVSFVPTYEPFTRSYADRSVLFVGAANTLYYPSGAGTVSVKTFRAYFQLHGVQMPKDSSGNNDDDDDNDYIPEGGGNVKPFIIDIEDDATGIEAIDHSPLTIDHSKDTIYNVAGQRIGKLQKGINIMSGKKVLK